MKNLKHQPIATILENGKEFIQERVERYIVWHNETVRKDKSGNIIPNRPLTERDIEGYRLSIQYSLIKAMANYILDTDIIIHNTFQFGPKGVEITLIIEREGKRHQVITDVIVAEGEIQCAHYRYLVKTDLRKIGSTLVKQLTGIDKAQENVDYYKSVLARYEEEKYDHLNIGFDEWLTKRSLHYRMHLRNKEERPTYQEIITKTPYMEGLLQKEFVEYKHADKIKGVDYRIKDVLKNLAKKEEKLKSLQLAL